MDTRVFLPPIKELIHSKILGTQNFNFAVTFIRVHKIIIPSDIAT